MLKPIHIDRVQTALDIMSSYYNTSEVTRIYLSDMIAVVHNTEDATCVIWDDVEENTDYYEVTRDEVIEAAKQLYGGDIDAWLSVSVDLESDYYEVISQTDILVPGATNANQVYTERRIGRVLR